MQLGLWLVLIPEINNGIQFSVHLWEFSLVYVDVPILCRIDHLLFSIECGGHLLGVHQVILPKIRFDHWNLSLLRSPNDWEEESVMLFKIG